MIENLYNSLVTRALFKRAKASIANNKIIATYIKITEDAKVSPNNEIINNDTNSPNII